MQGDQPVHTNVVRAAFTPKVVDGGKSRHHARRRLIIPQEGARDLSMMHSEADAS
jgi:hypothetical protein